MAQSTKERILDVAEQLFSGHGFGATSMRAITNAAGVNLAAVNYHFGSKDGLVRAIFERRLTPMNEERLRRLRSLEHQHGAAVPLAELIKAFVGPALELGCDESGGGARFVRLLGRSYTEPSETLQAAVRSMSEKAIERFEPVFSAALPGLEEEELRWRLHLLVGTLAYCMSGSNMMRLVDTSHLAQPGGQDRLLIRLTQFLAAGMQAPSSDEPVRSPFVVAAGHVRPSS